MSEPLAMYVLHFEAIHAINCPKNISPHQKKNCFTLKMEDIKIILYVWLYALAVLALI